MPLASSASVVSSCRTLRLAERADVERDPLEHVDPLMETIWHSSAEVDALKLRPFRAVRVSELAPIWLAAVCQMASHWAPVRDVVMTLEVVRRPPEAVISWLTET